MMKESSNFIVQRTCDKGRHVVACKEHKVGEIVLHEKCYCFVLYEFNNRNICNKCLKFLEDVNSICFGCNEVYCNDICKRNAWKEHHWFECFLIKEIRKLDVFHRLSLRLLLSHVREAHEKYNDHSDAINAIAKVVLQYKNGECSDQYSTVQSTNFEQVFSLQTHQHQPNMIKYLKDYETMTQSLVEVLLNVFQFPNCFITSTSDKEESDKTTVVEIFSRLSFSSYFNHPSFDILDWKHHLNTSCVKPSCKTQSDKMRKMLQYLIQHHLMQLQTNTQAIFTIAVTNKPSSKVRSSNQVRIASAIFPTLSLFNHSCNPNTSISFDGATITMKSSKPLRNGHEICHCYGPNFTHHGYKQRQAQLLGQYFFKCECNVCVCESEEDGEFTLQFSAFKCPSCGNPVKPCADGFTGVCINVECNVTVGLMPLKAKARRAEDLFVSAMKLSEANKDGEALKKFKESLAVKKSVLFQNHLSIGQTYDKIAQCYVLQNKFNEAVSPLCRSITIVGMRYGSTSIELGNELHKLATVYFQIGNFKASSSSAEKALRILKKHYHESHPDIDELKKIVACK